MTDQRYARPIPVLNIALRGEPPRGARLAGGLTRFQQVEWRARQAPSGVAHSQTAVEDLPAEIRDALSRSRPAIAGLSLKAPKVMGVLNITPDSFSDGGAHFDASVAVEAGLRMVEQGVDILDVGGESTRPGASPQPESDELARVLPVIEGLRAAGCAAPISIDTRKAVVARAAFQMGAVILNDISALQYDPEMLETAATLCGPQSHGWVCLMHSQGDPRVMQQNPHYENVTLDIYDALAARFAEAVAAGVAADRILIDPGVGFGKTLTHNLDLLRGLSLFHGLGAPVLLGVSRKSMIGRISGETDAARRAPGSIAVGLHGLAQGAHILRVHDVGETMQAMRLWRALQDGADL